MLKWNVKEQMWEARDIEPVNPDADKWTEQGREFAGESGVTLRLGRAMALRSLPNKTYDATRKAFGHFGPYLPVLLEACREDQLSYEYRHGVTSYGAFTYSVTQIFHDYYQRKKSMTWNQLIKATTQKLQRLRYNQTPVLVGPQRVIAKAIPWKITKKHP
jgi:hypothetical protein